jgi:polyribonucleotide nucleotidyltransferase
MSTSTAIIQEFKKTFDRAGKSISFANGKLATQAHGSVVITTGQTSLLITTCMDIKADMDKDFLPLMIENRELYSASRKIWGWSYRKREWRPSDQAILVARLCDRALRPMFPKGMVNGIVITVTPLSLDKINHHAVISIVGASLSTMLSWIPFDGPVGAVRIWYVDGQYIVNPTIDQRDGKTMNLLCSGKKWSINMIEFDGAEVDEQIILDAFDLAQVEIDKCCDMQTEFLTQCTVEDQSKSVVYNLPSDVLMSEIWNIIDNTKLQAMRGNAKGNFGRLYFQYEKEILDAMSEKIKSDDHRYLYSTVKMGFFNHIKYFIRDLVLEQKIRIDDRAMDEIRPLYCEVWLIPLSHGSALFQRWDTQILGITTLWAPWDKEISDSMEDDDIKKRYMHHYNFPPFSTGEAMGIRWVSRREIGHWRLAEKAIERIIPPELNFPYTIRSVSECLWSWWSTSMGSVCATTLSLMDAWVPIARPVSGIAMGLITQEDDHHSIIQHQILRDIMGTEDFIGDMDFKVAGTTNGITAIQLDTKLKGISLDMVRNTIKDANIGRQEILDFMLQTLDKPRSELQPTAPRIISFQLESKQIKEVIGKGGEVINKIIEKSGVKIDFNDEWLCIITAIDQTWAEYAKSLIDEILREPKPGDIIDGSVTRIEAYGVFVSLGKGKVWLCHIKNLWASITWDLNNHFKIGMPLQVKITGIDPEGKIQIAKA